MEREARQPRDAPQAPEAREPGSPQDPPQDEPRRSDLLTVALLVFFVALVLTVVGLLLAAQIWPDVFT